MSEPNLVSQHYPIHVESFACTCRLLYHDTARAVRNCQSASRKKALESARKKRSHISKASFVDDVMLLLFSESDMAHAWIEGSTRPFYQFIAWHRTRCHWCGETKKANSLIRVRAMWIHSKQKTLDEARLFISSMAEKRHE